MQQTAKLASTMKIVTILLLFIFNFPKYVFSQQREIDSLQQLLRTVNEDTNAVNLLNKIAYLYLHISSADYEKALPIAERAKNLSEKLGFNRGLVVACNNLGNIYGYYGVYEKTFKNYLKALKTSEKLNDSALILNSYRDLSFAYSLAGDHKKELQLDYKIAKMVLKSQDSDRIAATYWRLGRTYTEICKEAIRREDAVTANSSYDEAIKNDSMALYISEKRKDTQNIAFFSLVLGYLYDKCNLCEDSKMAVQVHYIKSDYFGQAEQNYLKALQIYQQLKYKQGLPDCYSGLALYYRNQGELAIEANETTEASENFEKSLNYFLKALSLLKELGYKHGVAYYSKETGITYLKMNQLKKAEEYMLKGANIFDSIAFKEGSKECYEKLSEVAAKRGDYQQAFLFYKEFSTLKDSMFNESKRKEILEMDIKYETNKKDAAILAEQSFVKNEKEKKNLAIVLGGVTLLSGGLITLLLFRRKQSRHAFQTRLLENKVLRSQLNPHFIFNALNSIQSFIHTHPETAESYLASFSNLMREVLENSEKETVTLEEELSMLRKYMDLESLRVSNGFDYEINVDPSVEEQIVKVPPLILQPIVENAIWHGIAGRSGKGTIVIGIQTTDKMLQCNIEDYCVGEISRNKEGNTKGKSMGLQIVRDRLSILSGKNRLQGYLKMVQTENGMKVQLGIPI